MFVVAVFVTACTAGGSAREVVVKPPAAEANYSPAIRAGGMVFLSGNVGIDPQTGELAPGGIEAETKQTLARIESTLHEAGLDLGDVVKCTVFLADMADYAAMNQVYRPVWPADPPARTTVQATPPMGARVEIECVAAAR